MSKLLIAGIGNVLLGDDGIGPFLIKVLKARYDVPEDVEFADLGTPALDFPLHFSGANAVILIKSADFGGAPGDIRLFREHEHLLIGVQSGNCHSGSALSSAVRQCIPHVIDAVVRELHRLGVWFEPKAKAVRPRIWWDYTERAA